MNIYGSYDSYPTKLREEIFKLRDQLQTAKEMGAFNDIPVLEQFLKDVERELEEYYATEA